MTSLPCLLGLHTWRPVEVNDDASSRPAVVDECLSCGERRRWYSLPQSV